MRKKKLLNQIVDAMENLDELSFQSLERYFTVLEKTGYMNDVDTNKLMLLLFLQEFLDTYSHYITEDDYNLINSIIVCLYSTSCLIPYVQYKKLTEPLNDYILTVPIRTTEEDIIRHSEIETLRLVNQ